MSNSVPCYPDCQYIVWYEGKTKCDSCTRNDSKPCSRPRDSSEYVNEFYKNADNVRGWEPY